MTTNQTKTKEMMADEIGRMLQSEPLLSSALFHGFSDTSTAAVLVYGARKEELEKMLNNILLADSSRRIEG